MTTGTKKKLAKRYLRDLEEGGAKYKRSREAFAELLPHMKPGEELKLGDGTVFVIVDQFAEKNIVWKPTGVERYIGKASRVA